MKHRPAADEGEFDAIEQVAADWMIRRDRGLSSAEEAELAQWLAADARHAAVFRALEETWGMLAEVEPAPTAPHRVFAASRKRAWLPAGLAAAAALVLGLFWIARDTFSPEANAHTFAATVSTQIGGTRTVNLPDGSSVQLNTDTSVAVQFSQTERRVRLARGEAHFTIAKDAERPFVVTAGGVDVRAVGTAFNVRLRPEAVEVLVTEGKVRVDDATHGRSLLAPVATNSTGNSGQPERDPVLAAGEKTIIPLASKATRPVPAPAPIAPVAAQAIKQALAWQERRLDFEAAPLAEIVAEINRYNRHKLVLADPRLEGQRFGGSFPAGDHATFVRLLEANFGVIAERKGGETHLRLAP